jgi:hypothetical protein
MANKGSGPKRQNPLGFMTTLSPWMKVYRHPKDPKSENKQDTTDKTDGDTAVIGSIPAKVTPSTTKLTTSTEISPGEAPRTGETTGTTQIVESANTDASPGGGAPDRTAIAPPTPTVAAATNEPLIFERASTKDSPHHDASPLDGSTDVTPTKNKAHATEHDVDVNAADEILVTKPTTPPVTNSPIQATASDTSFHTAPSPEAATTGTPAVEADTSKAFFHNAVTAAQSTTDDNPTSSTPPAQPAIEPTTVEKPAETPAGEPPAAETPARETLAISAPEVENVAVQPSVAADTTIRDGTTFDGKDTGNTPASHAADISEQHDDGGEIGTRQTPHAETGAAESMSGIETDGEAKVKGAPAEKSTTAETPACDGDGDILSGDDRTVTRSSEQNETKVEADAMTLDAVDVPALIILFPWFSASQSNCAKYIDAYRSIYPSADILLVFTSMKQLLWRPGRKAPDVRPAIPIIKAVAASMSEKDKTAETPLILLHAFSNAGSAMLARVREAYGRPFPPHVTIFDSSPGLYSFRRCLNGATSGLPRWLWVAVWPGSALITVSYAAYYAGRRDGFRYWFEMHNKVDGEVRRAYLYSGADEMIASSHVERHAQEAKSKGYDVRLEKFTGSRHVSHMRIDTTRYWTIVKDTWQGAQPVSSKL